MSVVLRTVNSQVSKGGASSTLYLRVLAAQEEKNWVERVPTHRTHFLLSNFGECKCSAALQVDIIRKREGG